MNRDPGSTEPDRDDRRAHAAELLARKRGRTRRLRRRVAASAAALFVASYGLVAITGGTLGSSSGSAVAGVSDQSATPGSATSTATAVDPTAASSSSSSTAPTPVTTHGS